MRVIKMTFAKQKEEFKQHEDYNALCLLQACVYIYKHTHIYIYIYTYISHDRPVPQRRKCTFKILYLLPHYLIALSINFD